MKETPITPSRHRADRVLLLNPPGEKPYLRDYYCSSVSKSGYYWHPIDLLVLSGRLAAAGFSLAVVDAIAEALSAEAAFQRVSRWNPDVVIFLTSAASWPEDRHFLARLARSGLRRLIGCGESFLGPAARLFQENPWLEAGLRDFTDPGIPEYLREQIVPVGVLTREEAEKGAAEQGRAYPRQAAGSGDRGRARSRCRPGNGATGKVKRGAHRTGTLLSYGVPRHELFPLARYSYPWSRHHPFASVLTAYGCPFGCRFCNSGSLGFKLREMGNIYEELRRVRELSIRQVFVKDMSFGADREHGLGFCRLLRDQRFSFGWNCYARLDTLDAEMLQGMAGSGCHLVQIGLETANPEVSRRMGKPLDRKRAGEIFGLCRRLGIRTGAHFVLGLPGESEQGIKETVALACELNPDYCSFNLFVPRYGSSLGSLIEAPAGVGRRSGPGPKYPAADSAGAWAVDPVLDPSEAYPFRSFCALDTWSLFQWRIRAYRAFYLRPGYLFRQALRMRTRTEIKGVMNNGWGLARNLLKLSVLEVFRARSVD